MVLVADCNYLLMTLNRGCFFFSLHRYLAMSSVDEGNGWCGGTLLGDLDENSDTYKHYAQLCEVLSNFDFHISRMPKRHPSVIFCVAFHHLISFIRKSCLFAKLLCPIKCCE